MSYDPNDYQVVFEDYNEDGILDEATLLIKGAEFKINRVYTCRGELTSIFMFRSITSFVDNDTSNDLIEIDWDTCHSGMYRIADQLGLKYIPSWSIFSEGEKTPIFKEVNI